MTSTSKPIIFFGTEDFSLIALTGLIEAGYSITAVVTKPDSRKGRGQKLTPPAVKVLATRHNIPVWQPQKLAEIADDIRALSDPLGVLVSYGKIIPAGIIDLFPQGIVNLHPSLLPRYRGPSPIESAIKNGDDKTGVSIMRLSPAMDAGPVFTAKEVPLRGNETRPELYQTLGTIGTDLLVEALPRIIGGSLQPVPQDDTAATYCLLLQKEDGQLNLMELTASEAERRVRAYLGFPKARVTIGAHPVIILAAHVTDEQKTPLDLKCRDGAFLSIDMLVAPSGRQMSGAEFLRGYKI